MKSIVKATSTESNFSGDVLIDKRRYWEARVEMKVLRIFELTTYQKLVYVVLCGHADRGGGAFPSVATIAQFSSCSERQVFRSLDALERCGLIKRIPRTLQDKRRTSTLYEIHDFEDYIPLSLKREPDGDEIEEDETDEAADMPDADMPNKSESFCDDRPASAADNCASPGNDQLPLPHDCQSRPVATVVYALPDDAPDCRSPSPVTGSQAPRDWQSGPPCLTVIHNSSIYNSSKETKDYTSFGGGESPGGDSSHTPPFGRREAGASAEAERGAEDKAKAKTKTKTKTPAIPYCMRQAAEYFLLKTGRTRITESEAEVLGELDKIHTASRVCREIDAVAEDFVRRNKSLLSLSLNYVFAKLRHQRTSPRAPDGRSRQSAVPDGEIDGISAKNFSNYQVDNVVGLFASGVIETKEELGEICEMWHLSEKEKERVFRAVENAGEIAGDMPAAVALVGNGSGTVIEYAAGGG